MQKHTGVKKLWVVLSLVLMALLASTAIFARVICYEGAGCTTYTFYSNEDGSYQGYMHWCEN